MLRNRLDSSPDDCYWLLVAAGWLLCLALFYVFLVVVMASISVCQAEEAPKIPPFKIPSFDGQIHEFKKPVPAMAPAPAVDGDALFRMVVNCFPERLQWGLELDMVAGARAAQENTISTFDTSGLSRYYVGIVAKMPLYSATEVNRERQTEYSRREQVASNLKALLQGLSDRRRAQRELGLYTSLEARSQERVGLGIVEVSEQIGFLEKVAGAQSKLDDANAAIDGARLALVGQCRDEVSQTVNEYLKEVIR